MASETPSGRSHVSTHSRRFTYMIQVVEAAARPLAKTVRPNERGLGVYSGLYLLITKFSGGPSRGS